MPDTVNRPTIESPIEEIFFYIEYLEDKMAQLNRNGAVSLAAAMNSKMIALADQINGMSISEVGFGSQEKKFDRFIKLLGLSADLIKNFKNFVYEYGDEIEKEDKKAENIMESFAKKKR